MRGTANRTSRSSEKFVETGIVFTGEQEFCEVDHLGLLLWWQGFANLDDLGSGSAHGNFITAGLAGL